MKMKFSEIPIGVIIKVNGEYALKESSKSMFIPNQTPAQKDFAQDFEFEVEEENKYDNT